MFEKFLETVEKYNMIKKGEGIVVGVSGGADSVSLLHLLNRIKDEYKLRLYAVHLNHQFRGSEADEDAAYVEKFCEKLGIKSYIYSKNILAYSKNHGITFEEAGRLVRYNLFDQVMNETKSNKIAVAQNMDDQGETLLMRLMRGSGLEGLSAIDYIRDGKIIRPILDISRKDIETYCYENHLMARIDKTNFEMEYTRNRIRLEMIPYIEEHFNPNIKETLSRTTNLIREDHGFINSILEGAYHEAAEEKFGEIKIDRKSFLKHHPAIKKRILRKAIHSFLGDLKNIQNNHIEKLLELIQYGQVGSKIDLPRGICAILGYRDFFIKWKEKQIEDCHFAYNMDIRHVKEIEIKEIGMHLTVDILEGKNIYEIGLENNKKYFDLDKIKEGLVIRNRKNGDRFSPFGMKGTKKLKDFFIDEKIPREERGKIPLVCDGNEIMWVVGHRISGKYKVDEDTKRILVVTCQAAKRNMENI